MYLKNVIKRPSVGIVYHGVVSRTRARNQKPPGSIDLRGLSIVADAVRLPFVGCGSKTSDDGDKNPEEGPYRLPPRWHPKFPNAYHG